MPCRDGKGQPYAAPDRRPGGLRTVRDRWKCGTGVASVSAVVAKARETVAQAPQRPPLWVESGGSATHESQMQPISVGPMLVIMRMLWQLSTDVSQRTASRSIPEDGHRRNV